MRINTDPTDWQHADLHPAPLYYPVGHSDPDWPRSHLCLTPAAPDGEVSDTPPFPDSFTLLSVHQQTEEYMIY